MNESKSIIYCCGKNRHTKFCPECGRSIVTGATGPLVSLISHLATIVGQNKSRIQYLSEDPHVNPDRNSRVVARCQKTIDKYQSWIDEVQKLLESTKATTC